MQSFWIVAIFVLLIAAARPADAVTDQAATGGAAVVVQWFVHGQELQSPVGTWYYQAAKPIQGLWHAPDRLELRSIYLDRLRDRRSDRGVPFLLVQW